MNDNIAIGRPIRVLHVVGSMGQGGIQSFLISLYRHINRDCVQFDFLIHKACSYGFEDEIRNLGGQVYYLQMPSKRNCIGYVTEVKGFLKEHQEYKIIHIHMRTVATVWTIEAKRLNRTTIIHSHNTTNGYGFAGLVKNVIQFPVRWTADYYMGCSVTANEWMFGKRIAHSEQCMVLNNGIDVNRFRFDPNKRKKIRSSLGIEDELIVLGNVGRLVEQKNQVFLVDLMKSLLDEDSTQKYKLIIIGDGPLQGKLRHRIDELGLREYVILLGRRSDVNDLLSAFDVFLLPSKNEGLGIAAIEAQAAGLPVLCSDCVPEEAVITNWCRKLPLNDLECWKNEVLKINEEFSNDDFIRTGLKEVIREAGFDIEDVCNQLCTFYYRLI